MLELDLLLRPFIENKFDTLSSEQQLLLARLLKFEDIEIQELTLHPEQLPEFQALIQQMIDYRKAQSTT